MLEPQILSYSYVAYGKPETSPIYINIPLREIKPTRTAESWQVIYDENNQRKQLLAKDHQIYRIAILDDGSVALGEGASIIHSYFDYILESYGIKAKMKYQGFVYFTKSHVYIQFHYSSGGVVLPPQWDEFISGVEATVKEDRARG